MSSPDLPAPYAAFLAASPPPTTTVDATGCRVPSFATCYAWYVAAYQSVYGSDTYLGPDSQDGAWIALQAVALYSACGAVAAAYAAFSPTTAQGVGLDFVVEVNGIERAPSSFSRVDLVCGGRVGFEVSGATVSYGGHTWALDVFVVGSSGTVVTSATCLDAGAVAAPPGTPWTIDQVTQGFQSVANVTAASPGLPVESDPTLKARQVQSVALPSLTLVGGVVGAVLAVPGVTGCVPHENDTGVTDADGVPPYSLALVVTGGDDVAVGTAIYLKKGGLPTYGSTTVTVLDPTTHVPRTVSFFRQSLVQVGAEVDLAALTGYASSSATSLAAALASYVSGLGGGALVSRSRCTGALAQVPGQQAFNITGVLLARDGLPPSATDLQLAFYEVPSLAAGDVNVVPQ